MTNQPGNTRQIGGRGLVKRYGSLTALADVEIEVGSGEVHAIVGENGAGKSTLAKILAGVVRPDAGTVVVDGEPVVFSGRADAIAAGIGFVPQQLSLVGELDLIENYLLASRHGRIDHRRARARLADVAESGGLDVPIDVPTRHLVLGQRQLGEILVALAEGANTLLLDEPTSSLGPVEVETLVAQVRRLAADGTGVVLISHRLGEVLGAADVVTVLRRGHHVHTGPTHSQSSDSLAGLMVGGLPPMVPRHQREVGPVRLRARGLSATAVRGPDLSDVDLEVRAGEIVGIAGVAGEGQETLVDVLVGLLRPTRGDIEVDDLVVTGQPEKGTAHGVAHIPEDRSRGLMPGLSVASNAAVLHNRDRSFRRWGMRNLDAIAAFATGIVERFGIRAAHTNIAAGALSGGNQQKLLVGRELERQPSVVIAHGPTQGLDIAASAALHSELIALADRGSAVILVSADLDEIVVVADRIAVLTGGRIVAEFAGSDLDLEALGRAMAGLMPNDSNYQEENKRV